jgi:hypothetical protein
VTVDGEDLDLYGRIERILEQVGERAPDSADAVGRWFGTPRNEGGFSVRALWALTPAGKTLLRRNHLELSPSAFFDNERRAQFDKPDPNRKQLFNAADAQATELWHTTCALINQVSEGVLQAMPHPDL